MYIVYLMCVWTWRLCCGLYGRPVVERVLVRGVRECGVVFLVRFEWCVLYSVLSFERVLAWGVRVWCGVSIAIWMMCDVLCVVFWAGVARVVRVWCDDSCAIWMMCAVQCSCIEMWSVFYNMCWSAIVSLLNKQMLFYMARYFWLQGIIYNINGRSLLIDTKKHRPHQPNVTTSYRVHMFIYSLLLRCCFLLFPLQLLVIRLRSLFQKLYFWSSADINTWCEKGRAKWTNIKVKP